MRIQMQVDQAVHWAVRDVTTHNQSVQEVVRSRLFEDVKIIIPGAHDTCEEPAS